MTGCFVFGAKVGFRFLRTADGAFNAQLSSVGADNCCIPVQIDEVQRLGVQFTNSTFMAAGGAAHFLNCTIWEAPGGVAQLEGNTQVNFSDCQFFAGAESGAIRAMQGVLTVRGCSFNGQSIAVALTPGVKAAIVIGNLQPGGLKVKNEIGECAQIALNERAPSAPSVGRYELWVFALILLFVIALIFWKKRRKNNQAI